MAETNRNYVLLNCFAAAKKAEYEGFRNRRETLGQYFLRTTAGVTLGSLAFAWRAHCMRTTCPECNEDAYFIPYVEHPFTMFCSLPDDFPDFPEKSHIYCSACGKENDLYKFEHDPQSKCRDFRLLLEKWKRCHRPAESGTVFETALHLLKLDEIYGEEITPSWR